MGDDQRAASAPADLAMNVVLPEMDGRIIAARHRLQGGGGAHRRIWNSRRSRTRPSRSRDRIRRRARRRMGSAARNAARASKRLACVLSDYPGKGGRAGYAVGLDTPQSVADDRRASRARRLCASAPSAERGELMARA